MKTQAQITHKLWDGYYNLLNYISRHIDLDRLRDSWSTVFEISRQRGIRFDQVDPEAYNQFQYLFGEYYHKKYSSVPIEEWINSQSSMGYTWEDLIFAVAFPEVSDAKLETPKKKAKNYMLHDDERNAVYLALDDLLYTDKYIDYRNALSDKDIKKLDSVYDLLVDTYVYPRITRSMLKDDYDVLYPFLEYALDHSDDDDWDFRSGAEKILEY